MMVVAKNTEALLLKDLQGYWKTDPAYRCVVVKFSLLELEKENWFSEFAKILPQHFEEEKDKVYICDDDDVFIVTRTFTYKKLERLLAHLSEALHLQPVSEERLAFLYEIGVDWGHLRAVCERKIEAIHIRELENARKVQERLAAVPAGEAIKSINADVLSTLHMRRSMRDKLEIMVVEDDAFTQRLLKNTLGEFYDLYFSDDGQGAIMRYVTKAPDVLFLDINLPDMDGHKVLEKVFEYDDDAFVVMFSGNGSKDNIMKSLELGAKGFIGKPFAKEKLFQYIEKSPHILAKKQRRALS